LDYFQGVVVDYLRANRATFVNTECCIQLNAAENPDRSGPHWFCDALAVNLHDQRAYLCEITYSKTLGALAKRLAGWSASWQLLRTALVRDCGIPLEWPARPWIFVPNALETTLNQQLAKIHFGAEHAMPYPKVTWMEDVVPWKYKSWNREHRDEA
jgi:hypothetical protein